MTAPFPFEISPEIRRNRIVVNGQAGAEWFDDLPDRIRTFSARWELTLHAPFTNASFNFVAPATRADGSAVVLKLAFPNEEALQLLKDGRGKHFDPRVVDVFFECLDEIFAIQQKYKDSERESPSGAQRSVTRGARQRC